MKQLIALFLVLSATLAQDQAHEEASDPKPLLTDAVLHFKAQKDVVVRVKVKHEKKPKQEWGVAADPFQGQAEAWRAGAGVTVIVSDQKLPGFCLYASDKRRIQQLTFEDTPPSLKWLKSELVSMLETDRFVKHVMDAHTAGKLTFAVDAGTGDVTFAGPIAREIVPPVTVLNEPMPRFASGDRPPSLVLRAEATLVVSKHGKFKSVAIKLVRNDPIARHWREGGRWIRRGGRDVEGGSTTYSLTFGDNKPSDRAREFKRRIQRMLGTR